MHASSGWNRRQLLRAGSAGTMGLVIGACGREPDARHAAVATTPLTSDAPIPHNAVTLTPDDPRLTFSSFATVDERSADRFRAHRFEDGQGLGAVTPGGRLAFWTNSPYVAFDVTFLGGIDGHKIRDDGGFWDPFYSDILVDGQVAGAIVGTSIPYNDAQTGSLASLSKTEKLIELIWPYERAMDLTRILLAPGATVRSASTPPRRIVCGGDSITQGFAADRPHETYAFRLARQLGFELVNMGFASRIALGSDGMRDGQLSPDIGTYMIGVNDFMLHVNQKRTLKQFEEEVENYIRNWFLTNKYSSSSLCIISPLYATHTDISGHSLQSYRDTMQKIIMRCVRKPFYQRLHYISGITLMPSSDELLVDGLHPTSRGHALIAQHLAAAIRLI